MISKKILDTNGLIYLLSLLQEYPNNDVLATVINAVDMTKADIDSPALTGIPTAPTAPAGTNNNQLATTAFVNSYVTPAMTIDDIDAAILAAG